MKWVPMLVTETWETPRLYYITNLQRIFTIYFPLVDTHSFLQILCKLGYIGR